jgi:hypothetical protein
MKNDLSSFPFHPAMFSRARFLAPSAWYGHVPFAQWLMAAVKPRTFVELGSHWGLSYTAFCQAAADFGVDVKCHAVDTWQRDAHAGFYPEDVFRHLDQFNAQHYPAFSRLLRMTFDDALAQFDDASVDLLHIDGLHTYDAVKHDFETWLPKMSDRGIVLFHDTNVRERDFGVWKLWEEVTRQYPHLQFDHSAGLGVLFVGKKQEGAAKSLIAQATDADALRAIKAMFSSLGDSVQQQWDLECARWERNDTVRKMQAHIDALSAELGKRDAATA